MFKQIVILCCCLTACQSVYAQTNTNITDEDCTSIASQLNTALKQAPLQLTSSNVGHKDIALDERVYTKKIEITLKGKTLKGGYYIHANGKEPTTEILEKYNKGIYIFEWGTSKNNACVYNVSKFVTSPGRNDKGGPIGSGPYDLGLHMR